ncbi:hypothetical protein ACHAQA_009372 [Verticillium albo-atrum]
MKFQLFAATIFAALAIATPVAPEASEGTELIARAEGDKALAKDVELALELVLTGVTAIPEDVLLEGDEATNDWLVENGFREEESEEDDGAPLSARDEVNSLALIERGELDARGPLQVTKCVLTITKVLATTFIPVARLLRIRRYLKLLGGVKKTVKLLVRAKTTAQRKKLGGKVLVALANELFGFQPIKNACSNL